MVKQNFNSKVQEKIIFIKVDFNLQDISSIIINMVLVIIINIITINNLLVITIVLITINNLKAININLMVIMEVSIN